MNGKEAFTSEDAGSTEKKQEDKKLED